MTKTTLSAGVFFLGAALGLSACAPTVADNPTWKDDIQPLMVARCLRCHTDPPVADPATTPAIPPAGFNFNYPKDQALPNPLPIGLQFLKTMGVASVRGELKGLRRMPPPPAEKLDAWEIELLDNWSVNPL